MNDESRTRLTCIIGIALAAAMGASCVPGKNKTEGPDTTTEPGPTQTSQAKPRLDRTLESFGAYAGGKNIGAIRKQDRSLEFTLRGPTFAGASGMNWDFTAMIAEGAGDEGGQPGSDGFWGNCWFLFAPSAGEVIGDLSSWSFQTPLTLVVGTPDIIDSLPGVDDPDVVWTLQNVEGIPVSFSETGEPPGGTCSAWAGCTEGVCASLKPPGEVLMICEDKEEDNPEQCESACADACDPATCKDTCAEPCSYVCDKIDTVKKSECNSFWKEQCSCS
ncbi:MAG: hypothetical protein AAF799_27640 [Myxococcota bacterium]